MRISKEDVEKLVTFGWRRGYEHGLTAAAKRLEEKAAAEMAADNDSADIIKTFESATEGKS